MLPHKPLLKIGPFAAIFTGTGQDCDIGARPEKLHSLGVSLNDFARLKALKKGLSLNGSDFFHFFVLLFSFVLCLYYSTFISVCQ